MQHRLSDMLTTAGVAAVLIGFDLIDSLLYDIQMIIIFYCNFLI